MVEMVTIYICSFTIDFCSNVQIYLTRPRWKDPPSQTGISSSSRIHERPCHVYNNTNTEFRRLAAYKSRRESVGRFCAPRRSSSSLFPFFSFARPAHPFRRPVASVSRIPRGFATSFALALFGEVTFNDVRALHGRDRSATCAFLSGCTCLFSV